MIDENHYKYSDDLLTFYIGTGATLIHHSSERLHLGLGHIGPSHPIV